MKQSDAAPTILLIEDESAVRAVVELILNRSGFAVLTAESGSTGVMEFQRNLGRISAVVVDFSLPEMEGTDVLREIRKLDPDVPALLYSGYGQSAILEAIDQLQPADFLAKPFKPDQLKAKLLALLKNR